MVAVGVQRGAGELVGGVRSEAEREAQKVIAEFAALLKVYEFLKRTNEAEYELHNVVLKHLLQKLWLQIRIFTSEEELEGIREKALAESQQLSLENPVVRTVLARAITPLDIFKGDMQILGTMIAENSTR